jgi:hypothetical protein
MLAGDTDGGSVKVDGVVPKSRDDERVYNGDVVELGTKMRALKTPEKFPEGRARAGCREETSELQRVELPMPQFVHALPILVAPCLS